jgi:hypothetical protein
MAKMIDRRTMTNMVEHETEIIGTSRILSVSSRRRRPAIMIHCNRDNTAHAQRRTARRTTMMLVLTFAVAAAMVPMLVVSAATTDTDNIDINNIDLSKYGYDVVWRSEEGFPVGGDPQMGILGYEVVTNTASSLEECAYRCSTGNSESSEGPSSSSSPRPYIGGQWGYRGYRGRCFCDTSIICREPLISEPGGIIFTSSAVVNGTDNGTVDSADKPAKCLASFCDYFGGTVEEPGPQYEYCTKPELQFQDGVSPYEYNFYNAAVAQRQVDAEAEAAQTNATTTTASTSTSAPTTAMNANININTTTGDDEEGATNTNSSNEGGSSLFSTGGLFGTSSPVPKDGDGGEIKSNTESDNTDQESTATESTNSKSNNAGVASSATETEDHNDNDSNNNDHDSEDHSDTSGASKRNSTSSTGLVVGLAAGGVAVTAFGAIGMVLNIYYDGGS